MLLLMIIGIVLLLIVAVLCFRAAGNALRRELKLKAEGKQTNAEKYGPKGGHAFPLE